MELCKSIGGPMGYYVKRSDLNRMKKKFDMVNISDYEFLQWWRRNHGTGFESNIKIKEGR